MGGYDNTIRPVLYSSGSHDSHAAGYIAIQTAAPLTLHTIGQAVYALSEQRGKLLALNSFPNCIDAENKCR